MLRRVRARIGEHRVAAVPDGEPGELQVLLAGAVARQRTEQPPVLGVQLVVDRRRRVRVLRVVRRAHSRDRTGGGGGPAVGGGDVVAVHVGPTSESPGGCGVCRPRRVPRRMRGPADRGDDRRGRPRRGAPRGRSGAASGWVRGTGACGARSRVRGGAPRVRSTGGLGGLGGLGARRVGAGPCRAGRARPWPGGAGRAGRRGRVRCRLRSPRAGGRPRQPGRGRPRAPAPGGAGPRAAAGRPFRPERRTWSPPSADWRRTARRR